MALRKRTIRRLAAALLGLLVLLGISVVSILQSPWFFEQVRRRIVSTVETATGGRVEAGSFHFDWKHLRAELRDFVIHGTEPPDRPPLFRAGSIVVGLKLVSILRRDVDIQSLTVSDPHVYLIVGSDGRTNIPEPKMRRTSKTSTMEDILKLAVGRFNLERGIFEVEAHSRVPFAAPRRESEDRSRRTTCLARATAAPLAIQPLFMRYDDYGPTPFAVNLAVTMEKNRIAVDSGTIGTGATQVTVKGALDDLTAPHARFQYQARVTLADVARIFRVPAVAQRPRAGRWHGRLDPGRRPRAQRRRSTPAESNTATRCCAWRISAAMARSSVSSRGVEANRLRLSGFFVHGARREAVQGNLGSFTLRDRNIEIGGVALTMLGGTFHGQASLRQLEHYSVTGELSGVDTRRAVALYSPRQLPWDALVFGPVKLEGSLRRAKELRAGGTLTLSPPRRARKYTARFKWRTTPAAAPSTWDAPLLSLPNSRRGFFGRPQPRTESAPGDARPRRPAARAGKRLPPTCR